MSPLSDYDEFDENWPMPGTIGGFWGRLIAFVVDGLFLGLIGFVVGYAFLDYFVTLGQKGRLVGFGISLAYFGILNSKLGGGQTLGKSLLRLRVVDSRGNKIGLLRSCARYTILALPFYLNGLALPVESLSPTAQMALVHVQLAIIAGGGLSIIYLYLFNARTRQSLHDRIMGTYVVDTGTEGHVHARMFWIPHWFSVGLIMAFVILYTMKLSMRQNESVFGGSGDVFVEEANVVMPILRDMPEVINAGVFNNRVTISGTLGKSSTVYFQVEVALAKRVENKEELAREIMKVVFEHMSGLDAYDSLTVSFVYGFDIGIFRLWQKEHVRYTYDVWKAMLFPDEAEVTNEFMDPDTGTEWYMEE